MRNLKNEKLIAIFGFLAFGLLLTAFSIGCKTTKKTEREAISLAMVTPVFGESKDGQSGAVDVQQTDQELIISYNFDTAELTDFDQAIGKDLAPKIRDFYKKFGQVDRVAFGIYVPSTTSETGWEPYVSFVMTKKLINETDWTELMDGELLKVAQEVKYAE